MSDEKPDDLLTTEEVAQKLRKQARTVRDYIAQGKLPAVDLDGRYLIYRKDLDAFLQARYKQPEKKK